MCRSLPLTNAWANEAVFKLQSNGKRVILFSARFLVHLHPNSEERGPRPTKIERFPNSNPIHLRFSFVRSHQCAAYDTRCYDALVAREKAIQRRRCAYVHSARLNSRSRLNAAIDYD